MMDKVQALNSFWNSFGLIAYNENTVPDDAEMPYITYNVSTDSFGSEVMMSAHLWYRSNSWAAITQKAEEISRYLGLGGRPFTYDGGGVWIKRSSPFAQETSDPNDESIRRVMLSITAEFISE